MPIGQRYSNFFAPAAPQMINHPTDKTKVYSFGHRVSSGKFHWLLVIAILFWLPSLGQTTLVDPAGNGGLESGTTFALNGWSVANGPFNNWYVGTAATGYSGNRGAFIGTNSSTYSYTNFGGMVNHMYRSVTVPTTQPNLTLSFKVKVVGNSNCNLKVYMQPTSLSAPVAGTALSFTYLCPTEPLGGYNTSYGSYTTITLNFSTSQLAFSATNSWRLVFSWSNNTTVNNPPAAVDDISLVTNGCSSYSGTGYVTVSSLPYSSSGRSTCGKVNDYTSSNVVAVCGSSSFYAGEDEIFGFKPTTSGAITITMSNASSTSSAMMLYQGCPFNPSYGVASCVAYNQTSSPSKIICTSVIADTSYFLLVDASTGGCYSYDISITAPGTAIPNELACGATPIPLGTIAWDDNTCSGGASEPTTPGCWTVGNLNSLWYSFVAPSSGSVHVRVEYGTLITPQIELFSGACGSLTSVGTCGDYSTVRCPGITWSGLTSGSTYRIRLDGYSNDVGSFGVLVDNNSGTLTPISSDCGGAVEICGNYYSTPNNSIGCGNIADVPSPGSYSNPSTNPNCCNSGCLLAGELNPRWYRLDVATTGTFAWTLHCPAGGFFDWEMWNITSSSCAAIASGSLAPVKCNWNGPSVGYTGMESPAPGGYTSNFEAPMTVYAGETYVICQTNYSYILSTPYTLDYTNSTCTFGGSVSTWTGYGGTTWSTGGSWSGCQGVPSCAVSGVVNTTATQPVITANASVKDLTVNTGATLTINAGVTLTVCGNFTNNGTLNISSTSTIIFAGTGTQTMTGSFTGANKLGNVIINKASGSVVASANIDIAGSFITQSSTSVFNANSKYIKLAQHFSNSSGTTTFTGVGTGTLEFNGAANQDYTPGGSLTLYNVIMNQSTTSTVSLVGGNLTFSGTLTLTNGRIYTGTGSNEVSATNAAVASVPVGNANSYVDGYLRRQVSTTGSYNFPVGEASSGKGWQRANINFTTATNVTNLLAKFQAYGSVPAALGVTDCANDYNMAALDNGNWIITSTPAMTSGAYTTTLYNTAGTYTNSAGATNWTVMKNNGGGWFLNGTCAGSTVNVVVRTGMSGFSSFGTAQSSTPLPIILTSFTGAVVSSGNWLQWVTSSELNNDYFVVEKSVDGVMFSELLRTDGAGTSMEEHTYEGYDFNPFNGINYYRLRQIDFNGHTTYSDMIALHNYSQSTIVTGVNPNPTTGDVHIELDMPVDAVLKIEVLNIFGAVINSFSTEAKSGSNSIPASLNAKEGGIYLLHITCDEVGYSYLTKVVKY